jgi:hypothetical protein
VERRKNSITHQTRPIRLPAAQIESSVCAEIKSYLANPIQLSDSLDLSRLAHDIQFDIQRKAAELGEALGRPTLTSSDNVIIRRLVQSIKLKPNISGYELQINLEELASLLDLTIMPTATTTVINVPIKLTICNNGKKVIIGNKPTQTPCPNPPLIKAIKSAHHIKSKYMGVDRLSLSNIAAEMDIDTRQALRTLKLAYLAPDIQLAILSGLQPKGLLLKDLIYQNIPTAWDEQRSLLGFA